MSNSPDGQTTTIHQDTFLRVKADKVSKLLDLVAELGLLAGNVTRHPNLQGLELEGFDNAAHNLELLIHEVQDLASGLRLVPINGVFKRTQRLVRDLSKETGKPVVLKTEGGDTEIDKVLVDQLHDPLMHIVRNAVDHGLEPVADRLAAGKPEKGQLTLSAGQQGREIRLTVADDGRGLNREKILKRARAQGLAGSNEEPDDSVVWSYIFHSGLSTKAEVSNLSGRGVGMDVVKTAIQSLRGRISVESEAGLGTRVTLHIPLTLAFLDGMVVRAQNRLYVVPVEVVSEVFQPQAEQLTRASSDNIEMVRVRDELIPICRLGKFYEDTDSRAHSLTNQIMVAVQTTKGVLGLPVDEVIGQQQVTMKSLQGQLKDIRAGSGCALLASGDVAIALDCERLVN